MMRKIVVLAFVAAGCTPPDRHPAGFYAENLREIHFWDPLRGAEGHYAYDAMMGSEPYEAVPVLIGKLTDKSPTAIDDRLHDPPTVGHVAFHILMRIFSMKPAAFERDGVWIMQNDPSRNPIYQVKFMDETSREKLVVRFRELGRQRGWLP